VTTALVTLYKALAGGWEPVAPPTTAPQISAVAN
jgi:hypothetical protein